MRRTSEGVERATIRSQPTITIRVWMQAVTDTYPTISSLHEWESEVHRSPNCPWCNAHVPETLAHFSTVCDVFHHASTAGHNQVWKTITFYLKRSLPPELKLLM